MKTRSWPLPAMPVQQTLVAVPHQRRHVGPVLGQALDQDQPADRRRFEPGHAHADIGHAEAAQARLHHLAKLRVGHVVHQHADFRAAQPVHDQMQHRQHLHQPVTVVRGPPLLRQHERRPGCWSEAGPDRRPGRGGGQPDLLRRMLGHAGPVERAAAVEHQPLEAHNDVFEQPHPDRPRHEPPHGLRMAGRHDPGRHPLGMQPIGRRRLEARRLQLHQQRRRRRLDERDRIGREAVRGTGLPTQAVQ